MLFVKEIVVKVTTIITHIAIVIEKNQKITYLFHNNPL